MLDDPTTREKRAVRIVTADGAVEGRLHVSPRLRTLDDLNMVARRFITLHAAKSITPDWRIDSGTLAINKASILFVTELKAPPPRPQGKYGTFERASIKLHVQGYEIEGFVHVPAGGAAMKRLDQVRHPFVSLTTVLVEGPGRQWTMPFLAVNRDCITAAQEVDTGESPTVAATATTEDAV